jgi:hypothetical protein
MVTESQVRELTLDREGEHVEFKRSLCANAVIGEYAVGIGNEGGGWLLMGITDDEPRRVVGIKPLEESDIQQIRRSVFDSTNIRIEAEVVAMPEGTVLAVKIPGRLPGQLFSTKDGKFLMRVGEDLRGMTQVEIANILRESAAPASNALPNAALTSKLEQLAKEHALVRLNPVVPATRGFDRFSVQECNITSGSLVVKKQSSMQSIHIPLSRVTEAFSGATPADPHTLVLRGRLQWLTPEERWEFFPEEPTTQEERTLGFAKQSSDYDDRARTVGGLMTSKGAHVGFINQNRLAEYLGKGGEIIYDSDGLYFKKDDLPYPQVLVMNRGKQ